MLKLKNITKDYQLDGDTVVNALRGIDLEFQKNEFVSVLGPSGCGKTTLLNVIGGLDKYTSGDLLINGKTTKEFTDSEWDSYRNTSIGFVFQNYNLIPHINVFDNVAIALTLSGVNAEERKARTMQALIKVGLEDQIKKKPNQLSGGQMQRVSIARALINNPKILLADEPTGALDSVTSVQIMDLIKEISKNHLVIMVTHNEELAEESSDRIIKMLDGLITDDSRPYVHVEESLCPEALGPEEKEICVAKQNGIKNKNVSKNIKKQERLINKKTSMSFITALKLSFKNLLTKKTRTIITSIAGSVGIIGVALVLAISSGMTTYVNGMQSDALAGFPVSISKTATMNRMGPPGEMMAGNTEVTGAFPTDETLFSYDRSQTTSVHNNLINQDFVNYLDAMDTSLYNSVAYTRGLEMTVIAHTDAGSYKKITTTASGGMGGMPGLGSSIYFNELPASKEFVESQYDLLGTNSRYAENDDEIVLIIDKYNRMDVRALNELGINVSDSYSFSEMLGRQFKIIFNNDYYKNTAGVYTTETDYEAMYNNPNSYTVTIVGILRVKESATSEILSSGIGYTTKLTDRTLTLGKTSDIAIAQSASETINVLTGAAFSAQETYKDIMQKIGASDIPTGVQIYPINFESKEKIKTYLDSYNTGKEEVNQIIYLDLAETITSMMSDIINIISIILVAFAAISLVVSTIMIAIITYVSVVERTKEIGILRAVGARKKDISRVFNAETLIIGFIAGIIGIGFTLLLSIPVNMIVNKLVGVSNIANLPILYGFGLVALSMLLTLFAGLIPSRIAANKDPVVALRTE